MSADARRIRDSLNAFRLRSALASLSEGNVKITQFLAPPPQQQRTAKIFYCLRNMEKFFVLFVCLHISQLSGNLNYFYWDERLKTARCSVGAIGNRINSFKWFFSGIHHANELIWRSQPSLLARLLEPANVVGSPARNLATAPRESHTQIRKLISFQFPCIYNLTSANNVLTKTPSGIRSEPRGETTHETNKKFRQKWSKNFVQLAATIDDCCQPQPRREKGAATFHYEASLRENRSFTSTRPNKC